MLQNRSDCRMVISSVLNRTHFYFLPLAKLTEILKLLEMPQTSQPNAILQYVFTGIMRLYQKYKQKIGSHLFNQKFILVSKQSKELLYNIFLHIHNHYSPYQSKTQSIVPSMNLPSDNLSLLYPQSSSTSFNLENRSPNAYDDEMKKYIEAVNKMYPYYLMNPQLGSSIGSSINQNVSHSALNPSLTSQYGSLSMPMSNPYLGYPTTSSLPPSFGQLKNIPRNISNPGMPFGMGSYPYSSTGSMYPPQYMGPYSPGNLLGGYGQTVPPSFSHAMGLDKNQLISKTTQMPGFSLNHELQKKYASSQAARNDPTQRNNQDKGLPKQPKFMTPHTKLPFNPQLSSSLNSNLNKPQDPKMIRQNQGQFMPKKQQFKDAKKLAQHNPFFKACACKGYYEFEAVFICSICNNKFHYRCLNLPQKNQDYLATEVACAHCRMRTMDPLNKVQETLGEFYLVNLFEKGFQSIINFKPFETKCKDKLSKYEIEMRCIRSGQHMKNLEITWPDECQIKINNDKIVDIPALQSNSSLKKRKDYSVFITQNIYTRGGYINGDILERIKISLELKPLTPEEATSKRIRNQFNFALGLYLVEKLNTDQLYAKIMSEQKIQDPDFLKNLMKNKEDEVQIDQITVRLIDPFSWDIIKTPVRGHKCNHAQCFDLKTFISLMYSAKNRTWKCPLCTKDARKFMLDTEQLQMIKLAQEITPIPKEASLYKNAKIEFKIDKENDDDDEVVEATSKTKKIVKEKKEETVKEK